MLKSVEYFIETRGNFCENCGAKFDRYINVATRHHCLVRVSKNHPEYDNECNIELVCHRCHASGAVDTFEHRKEFTQRQIERGYQVGEWIRSLPLKYIEDWLLRL